MPITLTDLTWRQIVEVNDAVNRLPYKTDLELYGRAEFWTIMGAAGGDCEDYALTKRQRLIDLGFDGTALLPAIGWTREGQKHAVLLVDSDKGAYVMDNIDPVVRAWTDPNVSIVKWDCRADESGQWKNFGKDERK